MLSAFGAILFVVSLFLGTLQVLSRIFFPWMAPKGLTTVIIFVLFFGPVNLFAIGLLGEYIAKIFEEVKQRPLFIRKHLIRDGEVRDFSVNRHK